MWLTHTHNTALLLGLLFALGASGCVTPADSLRPPLPVPTVNGLPLSPLARGAKLDKPEQRILLIRLRLIVIQAPAGTVSDSEELWSYLNEEPVGVRTGWALGQNGVRVGLGQESSWPEIAQILRRLTGSPVSHNHVLVQPGAMVPISFKEHQPAQTFFVVRPEGTLVGNDYPPGDNVLMMAATINFDDPASVFLSASPLVRTTHRQPRYVEQPVGFALANEPSYYPMEELAFQLRIPAGGFMLIGPNRESRRSSSLGRHFLLRQRDGLSFETVMVIAPEVFAARVRPE